MFVASPRGFRQAYWHARGAAEGSRRAIVCVHGWPETKRIFARVVAPLADAGHDVVVPDLRGFGDSEVPADGFNDVASHARDLHALVHDHLGYDSVVLVGGDLGGPVIQDLALRHPGWVRSMVLFNSPLPYDAASMAGLRTRPPTETTDYFVRQGTDADALAAELASPGMRRRYVATFYTSRFWAHPGAFSPEDIDWHVEPFADGASLRSSFGNYESVFDAAKRSERAMLGPNATTPTMVLFGTSDKVIYPDFDKMAEAVFARCVGPYLLRDCGHFVPWESPRALVGAVLTLAAAH